MQIIYLCQFILHINRTRFWFQLQFGCQLHVDTGSHFHDPGLSGNGNKGKLMSTADSVLLQKERLDQVSFNRDTRLVDGLESYYPENFVALDYSMCSDYYKKSVNHEKLIDLHLQLSAVLYWKPPITDRSRWIHAAGLTYLMSDSNVLQLFLNGCPKIINNFYNLFKSRTNRKAMTDKTGSIETGNGREARCAKKYKKLMDYQEAAQQLQRIKTRQPLESDDEDAVTLSTEVLKSRVNDLGKRKVYRLFRFCG